MFLARLALAVTERTTVARSRAILAVVVSKDRDFPDLAPPPPPVLHVVTGNGTNRQMKALFEAHFAACLARLQARDGLVEMGLGCR
jgi:predicted nuclease of predicted toxin-antitoxin system